MNCKNTPITRYIFFILFVLSFSVARGQSLSDLFNKDNINKVVNSVTGANKNINIEGTWVYDSSAIQFESDNFLMKAGGAAAATTIESKLNDQLDKVGISKGKFIFTFNSDSTFVTNVSGKTFRGTYAYNTQQKTLELKYSRLFKVNSTLSYDVNAMKLLFDGDKLLKLMVYLSKQSNSSSLSAISSIAEKYDGMLLGFELKKK